MMGRTMGIAAAALAMMAGAAWAQTNPAGSSEPIKPIQSQGGTGSPTVSDGSGADAAAPAAAKTGEFGGSGPAGTPAIGTAPRGTIPAAPAGAAKP